MLSQPLILGGVQSRHVDKYSHKIFAIHYDKEFGINVWLGDYKI